MAQSSATFHESTDLLKPETMDRHRAIVSLMEELEAVDWYDQRVDATGDAQLKAILEHNRDEEKEHAAMVLEWLRRHDPGWDEQLRNYLFTEKPVLEVEEAIDAAEQSGGEARSASSRDRDSLGIGDTREESQNR